MSPDPASWQERWEAALAELELDVTEVEAALRAGHLPVHRSWTPPLLGPMPAPLRERAEALLGRQAEVARQVAEAAALSRRQARAHAAMRATGPAGPLYVDQAG